MSGKKSISAAYGELSGETSKRLKPSVMEAEIDGINPYPLYPEITREDLSRLSASKLESFNKLFKLDPGSSKSPYDRFKQYGFSISDVIRLLLPKGGANNLTALLNLLPGEGFDNESSEDFKKSEWARLKALGIDAKMIVKILANQGGSKNMEAFLKMLPHEGFDDELSEGFKKSGWGRLNALRIDKDMLVDIVGHGGGSLNLAALLKLLPEEGFDDESSEEFKKSGWGCLKELGINAEMLVRILGNKGGSISLKTFVEPENLQIYRKLSGPEKTSFFKLLSKEASSGRIRLAIKLISDHSEHPELDKIALFDCLVSVRSNAQTQDLDGLSFDDLMIKIGAKKTEKRALSRLLAKAKAPVSLPAEKAPQTKALFSLLAVNAPKAKAPKAKAPKAKAPKAKAPKAKAPKAKAPKAKAPPRGSEIVLESLGGGSGSGVEKRVEVAGLGAGIDRVSMMSDDVLTIVEVPSDFSAYHRIKVTANGNCAFYSFIVEFLRSSETTQIFYDRMVLLFGEEGKTDQSLEAVFQLVHKSFYPDALFPLRADSREVLENLIANLRRRAIEFYERNPLDPDFISAGWDPESGVIEMMKQECLKNNSWVSREIFIVLAKMFNARVNLMTQAIQRVDSSGEAVQLPAVSYYLAGEVEVNIVHCNAGASLDKPVKKETSLNHYDALPLDATFQASQGFFGRIHIEDLKAVRDSDAMFDVGFDVDGGEHDEEEMADILAALPPRLLVEPEPEIVGFSFNKSKGSEVLQPEAKFDGAQALGSKVSDALDALFAGGEGDGEDAVGFNASSFDDPLSDLDDDGFLIDLDAPARSSFVPEDDDINMSFNDFLKEIGLFSKEKSSSLFDEAEWAEGLKKNKEPKEPKAAAEMSSVKEIGIDDVKKQALTSYSAYPEVTPLIISFLSRFELKFNSFNQLFKQNKVSKTPYDRLKECEFSVLDVIQLLCPKAGSSKLAALLMLLPENGLDESSEDFKKSGWGRLKALGINSRVLLRILNYEGGVNNLIALLNLLPGEGFDDESSEDFKKSEWARLKALGIDAKMIVKILANQGGSKNMEAFLKILPHEGFDDELSEGFKKSGWGRLNALGINNEMLVNIVGHGGGSHNLNALLKLLPEEGCTDESSEEFKKSGWGCLKELGINAKMLVDVLGNKGGSISLKTFMEPKHLEIYRELYGKEKTSFLKLLSKEASSGRIRLAIKLISDHSEHPELDKIALFDCLVSLRSNAQTQDLDGLSFDDLMMKIYSGKTGRRASSTLPALPAKSPETKAPLSVSAKKAPKAKAPLSVSAKKAPKAKASLVVPAKKAGKPKAPKIVPAKKVRKAKGVSFTDHQVQNEKKRPHAATALAFGAKAFPPKKVPALNGDGHQGELESSPLGR